MTQAVADANTSVATQPTPAQEAGYKLRLLVEKMLQQPNNEPLMNAAIATCMMADLIDAEISGHDAHWGYSANTARAMIERLREAGEGYSPLVQAYENLGYGKITPHANELALGMTTVLGAAILALTLGKTNTLLSQKEFDKLCLATDVIRTLNEHRKLRSGRGFVSDDFLELL